MKTETIRNRLQQIRDRAKRDTALLFDEVYKARTYPDGVRMQRKVPDGEFISGIIVGSGVYDYDFDADGSNGYPNVQYWVRIDSPADYNTHQQCSQYGAEMGKAQDFWQGDEQWSLAI